MREFYIFTPLAWFFQHRYDWGENIFLISIFCRRHRTGQNNTATIMMSLCHYLIILVIFRYLDASPLWRTGVYARLWKYLHAIILVYAATPAIKYKASHHENDYLPCPAKPRLCMSLRDCKQDMISKVVSSYLLNFSHGPKSSIVNNNWNFVASVCISANESMNISYMVFSLHTD